MSDKPDDTIGEFIDSIEPGETVRLGDFDVTRWSEPDDNVWGNCVCGLPKCAQQGRNHLGRMLMELRDQFAREAA